jgi:hypothetical protein
MQPLSLRTGSNSGKPQEAEDRDDDDDEAYDVDDAVHCLSPNLVMIWRDNG